jgi:hypothetical protein
MSELFELMHHAREVAETAKDAMGHSLAADKTTETLARTILAEAKRLLSRNVVLNALDLPQGSDLDWTSIRSAMQAVANALSEANVEASRSASHGASNRGGSTWG